MPLRVALLVGLLLAAGAPAAAQESVDRSDGYLHHHVGVMIGGMTPMSEGSATSFAFGAEYEYRFSELFGTGLTTDFTSGDHKRTALVATGVTYRLTPDFKVMAGPGFEVVDQDKPDGGTTSKIYFVWGFGAAYELHVGSVSLSPTVLLDLVGETKTNLTYGIAIGTAF